MAYVTTRDDSARFQFRMRVPQKVLPRVQGKSILILFPATGSEVAFAVNAKISEFVKFSLRTTDDRVAESRDLQAREHLHRYFDAVECGPSPLSQRQLVALAGDVYRLYTTEHYENPGAPGQWIAFKGINRAVVEGRIRHVEPIIPGNANDEEAARELFGQDLTAGINALPQSEPGDDLLDRRFGLLADWVLTRHGLQLHPDQRRQLLAKIPEAAQLAAQQLKRLARDDYTEDPSAARYPEFAPRVDCSLTAIFERWKRECQRAPSTVSTWTSVINSLRNHLGHEDMARLSTDDVVAWKDTLVTAGLKPKTINDGHLAALKTLLNFEVQNRRLPSNVAVGVRVQTRGIARSQMQPYTNEEVARLLMLAREEASAPRRWLPWLTALTGARIGELAQLWGSRVRRMDGFHVIELRPAEDGGTFKNVGSERTIPLHPALIAEGFLRFVEAKGSGPLFYGRGSGDPTKKHASKGVSNHLAAWVRKRGFQDKTKAPNHAFRHWFKTASARAGIEYALTDAIQGHAPRNDADGYRHIDVGMMAAAISKIPVPTLAEAREPSAESPGRPEKVAATCQPS